MNFPILSVPARNKDDASALRMGHMLVDQGKLSPLDAERVAELQRVNGLRFGETAIRLELVSESDVRDILARQFDYPILKPGQGRLSVELYAAYDPYGHRAELLRAVRGQLLARWFDSGRHALAIVATQADAGAALFSANLAVLFAQLGLRTVLVDANLRQPEQHRIFNLGNGAGFSDMLAKRAGLEAIQPVESLPCLSILPAGPRPPNPQELVSRDAFIKTRDSLIGLHDIVLYDLSPFSDNAGALTLCTKVGGVLLLVRTDSTRSSDVQRIGAQLAELSIPVVGSVVIAPR